MHNRYKNNNLSNNKIKLYLIPKFIEKIWLFCDREEVPLCLKKAHFRMDKIIAVIHLLWNKVAFFPFNHQNKTLWELCTRNQFLSLVCWFV